MNAIIERFVTCVNRLSGRGMWVAVPLIVIVVGSGGCGSVWKGAFDEKYDNSPIYIDPAKEEIRYGLNSVYRIETITRFKLGGDVHTIGATGLATALDEHHLLTAKHVVQIDSFRAPSPFGIIEIPLSERVKVEEKSFIVEDDGTRVSVERIYTDEKDFALLKSDRELPPLPFAFGNSEELKIGNLVFLLGNFQTGWSVRMGNVTQLTFTMYGPGGEAAEVNSDIFGISALTAKGDSGAPILGVKDGQFELIGIVTFLVENAKGLGFCLKMNPIRDHIRGIPTIANLSLSGPR